MFKKWIKKFILDCLEIEDPRSQNTGYPRNSTKAEISNTSKSMEIREHISKAKQSRMETDRARGSIAEKSIKIVEQDIQDAVARGKFECASYIQLPHKSSGSIVVANHFRGQGYAVKADYALSNYETRLEISW